MLGSEDSKKVKEVSLLCYFRVIKSVTLGQAMRGLHRLEIILPSSKGRKKPATPNGVGKFLKSHLLGLISYLVDKLQGIQGRETLASKQQTLRGLGALISHVGMEISIVAPQVS
jgi:serine/threonine-protein kinase ATR